MTFTFATRPVIDQEALQEATRAQSTVSEDELIGFSAERLAALSEVALTASELEGLVSQGMTIVQEVLGELERRGAVERADGESERRGAVGLADGESERRGAVGRADGESVRGGGVERADGKPERRGTDGITGEIANHREDMNVDGHEGMQRSIKILEQRVGNIRKNPGGDKTSTSGGSTNDNARDQTGETDSAIQQTIEKVTDGWEAGTKFGANPTQENAQKAACTVAGGLFSILAMIFTKSVSAGGTTYELVKAGCNSSGDWDPRAERRRRQEENRNKRPWYRTPHPDEAHGEVPEHLRDLVDRDLSAERIRSMNPRVDPHETDSSGLERIIEYFEVLESMDLVHGGTSTGAFAEEGTIRLDQLDFSGFLGSHGGTSTGGGQLI